MKIGIVLSGGGIRGIAHLGVLQALKTALGINFCKITGTSAGSIVGALFAEGHNPYEILQVFLKLKLFKYLRPAFGISGLLSMERVANLLREYIPHNSFEGLQTPLVITATNFSKGKLEYFSKGELILPILASSTLPGIFAPVMIGTDMYVDGGVKNNFPVEALTKECDFIIGSSCNHLPAITHLNGIKHYMLRAATMIVESDMEEKRKLCDVVIAPENIGEISVFDIGKAEEIYWIGYDTTLQQLKTDEKLKMLIKENAVIGLNQ